MHEVLHTHLQHSIGRSTAHCLLRSTYAILLKGRFGLIHVKSCRGWHWPGHGAGDVSQCNILPAQHGPDICSHHGWRSPIHGGQPGPQVHRAPNLCRAQEATPAYHCAITFSLFQHEPWVDALILRLDITESFHSQIEAASPQSERVLLTSSLGMARMAQGHTMKMLT